MDSNINYELFTELKIQLTDDTINFCKNVIDNTDKWIWPSTNLPHIYLTNKELSNYDFGQNLNDFIKDWRATLSILTVPPNCTVPWHIDVNPTRRCVLNSQLIDYPDSCTLVTSDSPFENNPSPYTCKIPYAHRMVYLLNSQRYHTVFNCSNEPRYVISFCSEFLTYPDAIQYFSDKNLISRQW